MQNVTDLYLELPVAHAAWYLWREDLRLPPVWVLVEGAPVWFQVERGPWQDPALLLILLEAVLDLG